MKRILVLVFVLVSTVSLKADPLDDFAAERLRDAVLVYDKAFRVPETGQYLDSIRLDHKKGTKLSSIAATGMGLISLAIGDANGAIPDAAEKAEITLSHLLGVGVGEGFNIDRSSNGWYRHWFNARTGASPRGNKDKYSTIDTAILGAGASILGSYFREKSQREGTPLPKAAKLAQDLVMSIDWTTSIRNPDRGSIHLVFYGVEERPTDFVSTIPFDEYALLPCMAARYEETIGRRGAAIQFWENHFNVVEELPMPDYGGFSLLGKPGGSVPSHFTHQFAFYLCGDYARDPAFLDELRELQVADRYWFEQAGVPSGLWGLGAGSEIVFDEDNNVTAYRYGVSRLGKNPHDTASPAIMAGFLPVDIVDGKRQILGELKDLWDEEACRYEHEGLGFLWRCSAKDSSIDVGRLEAIDFSTWMLGLATTHPEVGLEFFQKHTF